MKVNELKKYIKRVFKEKVSITHAMIIALILGAGMYAEVNAATTINNGTMDETMEIIGVGNTGINNGIIEFTGDLGMHAKAGSKIINRRYIHNDGDYGMYAEAEAKGKATVESTANNLRRGRIHNDGDYGMYAEAEAKGNATATSTANNLRRGRIINDGDYGMYAKAGAVGNATATSTANNYYGYIANDGDYGMYAEAEAKGNATATSTANNLRRGRIINDGDYGMYAKAGAVGNATATSTANNYGYIMNTGNYRMYAEGAGAEAVNWYRLNTEFDGYVVMKGTDHGTITNNGIIFVNHDNGVAMYVDDGATAVNGEFGRIYLYADHGTGMYATGKGSTIENRGIIYLDGIPDGIDPNGLDLRGNVGMKAEAGGTIVNAGTIVYGNN